MNHERYSDDLINGILQSVKTVAVVGASANNARPSFFVVKYLAAKGYKVFPVNPGRAGGEIAGLPCYGTLADIEEPIDMVDVFRTPDKVPGVLDEVLALSPVPKVFWLQLGIRNDEAAARAEAEGLTVIQNRCPKIEFGRLSGEISWAGVNSGVVSARRPARLEGFQRLGIKKN